MWTYQQATGHLLWRGVAIVAGGYSGWGEAKNNPAADRIPRWGPIPRGRYQIGERFDSERAGVVCFRLTPCEGTDTFGRGEFLIRGDSIESPGAASHGSIVLPRDARLRIAESGERELEVK